MVLLLSLMPRVERQWNTWWLLVVVEAAIDLVEAAEPEAFYLGL